MAEKITPVPLVGEPPYHSDLEGYEKLIGETKHLPNWCAGCDSNIALYAAC